jgi:hypothetical protein
MFKLGCFLREHLLSPREVVTIINDLGRGCGNDSKSSIFNFDVTSDVQAQHKGLGEDST